MVPGSLLVPLLLLLPAAALAAPAPLSGGLDACSDGQTHTLSGFAPLSVDASATPDSAGFTCYRLFVEPGFPFRGTLRASLFDGLQTAYLEQRCDLSGLDPLVPGVVGCGGRSGSTPALRPGPMNLRCLATDPASADVLRLGGWTCGVIFGH
jgi:hypothetical protein